MQSDVQFFNRISHFAWHFVTFTVYMLLDFNVFSVYMHYAFIRFIFFWFSAFCSDAQIHVVSCKISFAEKHVIFSSDVILFRTILFMHSLIPGQYLDFKIQISFSVHSTRTSCFEQHKKMTYANVANMPCNKILWPATRYG